MYTYNSNYGEKLFVGNLPFNVTDAEIWSLFASFGQVMEVVLLGSSKSKSGQGCAFVRFADHECAINAINHLDGRIALRPHEDAALLLQVRPARSNTHPSFTSASSHSQQPSSSSMYNMSSGQSGGVDQPVRVTTSYEVYQPVLPHGSVRLFVGNIPLDVTTHELNDLFRAKNIGTYESETFIMTGSKSSHNSICAFVVVISDEESKRAIDQINNKISMRQGAPMLKVKVANQSNHSGTGSNSTTGRRHRSYSDIGSNSAAGVPPPPPPPPSMHHHPGFFHPHATSNEYIDWKEPSIKTYHPYMMMPQSAHYGPLNIIPGSEPWRNNGIYSLPPASYTPFMGH